MVLASGAEILRASYRRSAEEWRASTVATMAGCHSRRWAALAVAIAAAAIAPAAQAVMPYIARAAARKRAVSACALRK